MPVFTVAGNKWNNLYSTLQIIFRWGERQIESKFGRDFSIRLCQVREINRKWQESEHFQDGLKRQHWKPRPNDKLKMMSLPLEWLQGCLRIQQGRERKKLEKVTFIPILERLTLWAWGDYNYKLSRKTWSLTSWQFSSCPWQLSLCGDSDQFQPPEHGCRVGLKCHHQCSEWARITCYCCLGPLLDVGRV